MLEEGEETEGTVSHPLHFDGRVAVVHGDLDDAYGCARQVDPKSRCAQARDVGLTRDPKGFVGVVKEVDVSRLSLATQHRVERESTRDVAFASGDATVG